MLPGNLHHLRLILVVAFALSTIGPFAALPAAAQSAPQAPNVNTGPSKPVTSPALPKDYLIGVEDVLSVVFYFAKELSTDGIIVRPDGKISLPGLADVPAAGMTPVQLAAQISEDAKAFGVKEPGATATVIVKEIHSRKVYVSGLVGKPGSFPLIGEMNVLQAIAEAGGFLEDAKKGDVVIVRNENGTERRYKFNYNDFVRGKHIQQNIRLLPGDTILIR